MPELHFLNTPEFWQNLGSKASKIVSDVAAGEGLKLANFVLGADQNDPEAPMASIFYMPPGYVLLRHAHDCYRCEVVIQGSIQVGDRTLRPGDVATSRPHEAYGPHTAGPTGCLTVEIFSRQAAVISEPDPDGASEEYRIAYENLLKMIEAQGA